MQNQEFQPLGEDAQKNLENILENQDDDSSERARQQSEV
jgi:hypothetical protein